MAKPMYAYIMANLRSKVIYSGITNSLRSRVSKHKKRKGNSFTARYNVTSLVYFEQIDGPLAAIKREDQLKWMRRAEKLALIDGFNPEWKDLYDELGTKRPAYWPPRKLTNSILK